MGSDALTPQPREPRREILHNGSGLDTGGDHRRPLACATALCVEQRRTLRMIHLSALALTLRLSSLFNAFPAVAGISQRALYIVGFGWLVYLEKIADSGNNRSNHE
jgi:hypothetical protein